MMVPETNAFLGQFMQRWRVSLRDAANPLDYIRPVAEKLTKEKLLDFLARLGASARTPAKLERGHAKDLLDVSEMLRRRLVTPAPTRKSALRCPGSWRTSTLFLARIGTLNLLA